MKKKAAEDRAVAEASEAAARIARGDYELTSEEKEAAAAGKGKGKGGWGDTRWPPAVVKPLSAANLAARDGGASGGSGDGVGAGGAGVGAGAGDAGSPKRPTPTPSVVFGGAGGSPISVRTGTVTR